MPFRYFDSDMAKKRPLVVSFRRIQKMTPNTAENCDSVSICDIHRLDVKPRDNNEITTMKILSRYNSNPLRMKIQTKRHSKDSQCCRNFLSSDKQKLQLDSLYDENRDMNSDDKGCVYPKEKFYGNAKILLTMNDDILRKDIIDCEEDSLERHVDTGRSNRFNVPKRHHLGKDETRNRIKGRCGEKVIPKRTIENGMIDEERKWFKRGGRRITNSLSEEWKAKRHSQLFKEQMSMNDEKCCANPTENGTQSKSKKNMPKSSSMSSFRSM